MYHVGWNVRILNKMATCSLPEKLFYPVVHGTTSMPIDLSPKARHRTCWQTFSLWRHNQMARQVVAQLWRHNGMTSKRPHGAPHAPILAKGQFSQVLRIFWWSCRDSDSFSRYLFRKHGHYNPPPPPKLSRQFYCICVAWPFEHIFIRANFRAIHMRG